MRDEKELEVPPRKLLGYSQHSRALQQLVDGKVAQLCTDAFITQASQMDEWPERLVASWRVRSLSYPALRWANREPYTVGTTPQYIEPQEIIRATYAYHLEMRGSVFSPQARNSLPQEAVWANTAVSVSPQPSNGIATSQPCCVPGCNTWALAGSRFCAARK